MIIGPDLDRNAFAYLDDIPIVSNTFEEHIEVLKKVLNHLDEADITLSKDKCNFCKPKLKYLRYVVDKFGLWVNPVKVEAVRIIPSPKSVKKLRKILDMISWYRRSLLDYSTLIAPLNQLAVEEHKF